MQIKLKPWNGNERLYFYRQSPQLSGQTGQIGKLRADFDRDGNGFFSTWEDIRSNLKTEDFKTEFNDVINYLRFEADGTPLGNRKKLYALLGKQRGAELPGDEEWYGVRADTNQYSCCFSRRSAWHTWITANTDNLSSRLQPSYLRLLFSLCRHLSLFCLS